MHARTCALVHACAPSACACLYRCVRCVCVCVYACMFLHEHTTAAAATQKAGDGETASRAEAATMYNQSVVPNGWMVYVQGSLQATCKRAPKRPQEGGGRCACVCV